MHLLPFNINETIFVKLTVYGVEKYLENYNKHPFDGIKDADFVYSKMNEEGYISFQAWDFMNIFGEHMFNGAQSCIQNNKIFFEEKTFKDIPSIVTSFVKSNKLLTLKESYK